MEWVQLGATGCNCFLFCSLPLGFKERDASRRIEVTLQIT